MIIEFTGLSGVGKSTILKSIINNKELLTLKGKIYFSEDYNKTDIFNEFDIKYNSKSILCKLISRFIYLLKNFKLTYSLIIISYFSKCSFLKEFNYLTYLFYQYDYFLSNKNNIYIFDEYLIHKLIIRSTYIKFFDREKIIFNVIEKLEIDIFYFFNDLEKVKNRLLLRYRKNSYFDKIDNIEKEYIIEKNFYFYEHIIKKYCFLRHKKFLKINSDDNIFNLINKLNNEFKACNKGT